MTNKQKEKIKDNLNAYKANFGYIEIVKADYGKGFYIYTSEERQKELLKATEEQIEQLEPCEKELAKKYKADYERRAMYE